VTASALVAALEARGLRLELEGSRIVVERVDGALHVTKEEIGAIRSMESSVIAFLRGRTLGVDWSRLSLYQLDRVLEIAVPWFDLPLILAPGCRLARELRARDPNPGRVRCVCEVLDLLLSGVTVEDARKMGEARLTFGGALAGVCPGKTT
jgi:hypothetical protein